MSSGVAYIVGCDICIASVGNPSACHYMHNPLNYASKTSIVPMADAPRRSHEWTDIVMQ